MMKNSFLTGNCAKHLNGIIRLFLVTSLVLVGSSAFGQLQDLDINTSIQSGQIQTIDSDHTTGIIQFIVVDLDGQKAELIQKELNKYSGEIVGYGQAVIDNKIIISYTSPMYPNFILAILDRVNISAFYNENGTDIYYTKDGHSSFIR